MKTIEERMVVSTDEASGLSTIMIGSEAPVSGCDLGANQQSLARAGSKVGESSINRHWTVHKRYSSAVGA
jgi:hypothetical protein